jgi:RND superfamily putative drug exporter
MNVVRLLAALPSGRRRKWLVILIWLLLGASVGSLARDLQHVRHNDPSVLAPHSAESTTVRDKLSAATGGQTLPVVIVYARTTALTSADADKAEADRQALLDLDPTAQQALPSQDGKALLLAFTLGARNENTAYDAVKRIRARVQAGDPDGLRVSVTGPAGFFVDAADAFLGIDLRLLLVTIIVVGVLLLLIYRSPVLWLPPLLVVLIATGVSQGLGYLLVKYTGLVVTGLGTGVLTVLVFGAGTDYALLLVARYREALRHHEDRHEAMREALNACLPSLLASGATVTLGLLTLLAAEMNTNRTLGPIGALGIVCVLLAMITLFPAILLVLGRWAFWPFVPAAKARTRTAGLWGSVAGAVGRRPLLTAVLTAFMLVALAGGLHNLRTGVPGEQAFRGSPDAVVGEQLLAEHFPGGAGGPADIVTDGAHASAVAAAAQAVSGVSRVLPANVDGGIADVRAVLNDPPQSTAAKQTIERLRAAVHAVPGADALVGGQTAVALDTDVATRHDRNVLIPTVLGLVLLVLILLLRSIVAPVTVVATVALSFFGSLGATFILFDKGMHLPAYDDQAIVLGFVFLVALGVDYSIFLMSRVRDEVIHQGDHRKGVLSGLTDTGGVITGAGVVLAATFAVLTVFPLVLTTEFGILVAFGVLLDTLVVRSLLVPALVLKLGRTSWWPSPLARRSPPADVPVPTQPRQAQLEGQP